MINFDHFCLLAADPQWQAWLRRHHISIYNYFISQFQHAKGCKATKSLMQEVWSTLERHNLLPKLYEFLNLHHPDIMMRPRSVMAELDEIFEYYNPALISYPRRHIIVGSSADLVNLVAKFCGDKFHCEHMVIGGRAYVEYLLSSDAHLLNKIPTKNWKLRNLTES